MAREGDILPEILPRLVQADYITCTDFSPPYFTLGTYICRHKVAVIVRAGTNTNMYSRMHFFSEAKLGNRLSVLVYACTMYSAQKFHFANLVYYRYCLFDIQV